MSFALSKAVDPNKVFLTRKSEIVGRCDPNYYRYMGEFLGRIRKCAFPVKRLDSSLALIQYGSSDRATDENVGTPMLRMINLQDDSWDISDLKYIQMDEVEKKSYLLENGDLLFNRTNSKELVGKCNVFDLSGDYVFASYLIRVRTKPEKLAPDYVAAYLASTLGRMQVNAVSRQIAGMTNINAEEIRDLLIPVPELDLQHKIVEAWKSAIQKRDATNIAARQMLLSVDDLLLNELGITPKPVPPNAVKNRIFRRAFSAVTGNRLDPHFHHPAFKQLNDELRIKSHARLGDVAGLSHELWDQKEFFTDTFPYIEIGSVDMRFGQILEPTQTLVSEAPSRAQMLVREGDLLVSLTRPTRQAIAFAPKDPPLSVASNGFAVLREIDKAKANAGFLFHVLRSCLCTPQFAQRSSGGSYPAISEEQLLELIIPLPDPKQQEQIVARLEKVRTAAHALRRRAAAELSAAKKEIEAMILGGT